MSAVATVGFGAGIAFLAMGAWPVFGFCGLEVVLIYVCFRLNYRSGRMFERVRLTDRALTVERHSPRGAPLGRSEEHTSELQSLMRISYAVFCLKKKNEH